MNLFSGSMILVAFGWGAVLLILWNLYRHTGALSKRGFFTGILVTTAVALGGVLFLFWQASQKLPQQKRLVVFPFLEKTAHGYALTPQGLAFAEQLTAPLLSAKATAVYPLPTDAIFEIANFDSLHVPDYLFRLANAAGVQMYGIGVYETQGNGENSAAKFQLFERHQEEPLLQHTFTISAAAFAELHAQLATTLALAHAPAPFSASAHDDYYPLLLRFLHHEDIVAEVSELAQRDTSDHLLLELSARVTLRHLREKRATETEWQQALKTLIPRLQRALRQDSLRSATYLLLAQCHLQQKKWLEAEKLLRRARALHEQQSKSYVYLAQLHPSRYAPDGFANELELYQYALALNPFDLEAAVGAADYLILNQRAPEATALLAHYRRINPQNLAVLKTLGRLYINQGDMPNTLAIYEEIIRLDSKDANAFYNLGIAYYAQKDFENAIKFFERAITLDDHADARLYLAYVYEQRGDLDKSIAYLRERIQLSTGEDDVFAAEARKQLYRILLQRGEIPEHLQPDKFEKN